MACYPLRQRPKLHIPRVDTLPGSGAVVVLRVVHGGGPGSFSRTGARSASQPRVTPDDAAGGGPRRGRDTGRGVLVSSARAVTVADAQRIERDDRGTACQAL
jgi:hypothetical protein